MSSNSRTPVPVLENPPSLRFRIRRGLDIPISGKPEQVIVDGPRVTSVALLGEDFVGLRPTLEVHVGESVRLGQTLFRDRRDPRIVFTSPGTGTVAAIHRGARRALQSVVVELDEQEEKAPGAEPPFAPHERDELRVLPAARVTELLLGSGMWSALRTRPYGKVPAPDGVLHALFVTAVDSNPLAPSPEVVIGADAGAFADGLTILSRLLEGPVFLCTRSGSAVPSGDPSRITHAEFSGPHPSGLVGTHVGRLAPVSARRMVWYVGYQDVIAVGRLFTSGWPSVERVVALAGPAVRNPRLIRTRMGAHIDELVRSELRDGPCRVVSGPVLAGRHATGGSAFLGRYHHQVSVLPEPRRKPASSGRGRHRPWSFQLSLLRPGRRTAGVERFTTALGGPRRAMIPFDTFDRVLPLDVLPTPLLRALLIGDAERAEALGCLELEEEDLALCTFLCPGKNEYGLLLRAVLDQIERSG